MKQQTKTTRQYINDLKSPDAETRRQAIYALRHTRSKTAVRAIIEALDDPETQEAAAAVLSEHKDIVEAVPKLISLLKSSDVVAKVRAARALGNIRDPRAVEPLIDLLFTGDDQIHTVAEALGRLGDPRALRALTNALRREDSPLDRESIWYEIGRIGCAKEAAQLAHLLETEDWSVKPEDRRRILDPSPKPLRRLPAEQIEKIRAEIGHLADCDRDAVWRMVSKLGRRRGQVVELLAEATASPNTAVRHQALHALQCVGDPRAYPVVLEMTLDPVMDTRWCALEILGELGKERAISVLIERLRNHTDSAEVDGAVRGLMAVGKAAIPATIELLETGNDDARMSAAWVLSRIGVEEAIGPLSTLLDDPNPDVREAGISSLEDIGVDHPERLGRECLRLIEGTLVDPVEGVRDSAASSCRYVREALGIDDVGECVTP